MDSTKAPSSEDGFVRVRIENFKLWYVIYNPEKFYDRRGRQCPLLVIHGGPGMPHGYLKNCFLHSPMRDRAVIFYDQLGCGNSDKPPEEHHYSMASSVADLHCLMKELGTLAGVSSDTALNLHFAGHSFGGMLAYDYLSSNLYRDNQQLIGLRSVLLLSTPTSTRVSMDASLKCKQKLIGAMVSANMGCASFVAMDDIDVRAAEQFVDTHMYRPPAPGVHIEEGWVGPCRPTLESLIDRSVPSWDGVHTKDLRDWAAWCESGHGTHGATGSTLSLGGGEGQCWCFCVPDARVLDHWTVRLREFALHSALA